MPRKRQSRPLQAAGEFRVIGGICKRRRLSFPGGLDIRPTPDRLRETLFNWLMHDIDGARVLDLFAGSGALGIEALSRGAASVDFVEVNRVAAQAIDGHLQTLGLAERARVQQTDARQLQGSGRRYDVVFLDPPYASADYARCLDMLVPMLSAAHRVYVEHAANGDFTWPPGWQELRCYRAGHALGRLAEYTGEGERLEGAG